MEKKKTPKADLESKRPIFLSIGMVLALSFVLLAFSWKTPVRETIKFDDVNWDVPDDITIPLTPAEKKEIAPPPLIVPEFVLVDNNMDIPDPDLDPFDSEITAEGIDVKNMVSNRKEEITEDETIYQFTDEMPEFPGGMNALLHFISQAVHYPVVAAENGIQGKVFVNFVINKDGRVSDAKILRGVDPALNKEALRVVNSLPRWSPGRQSGKAVRVAFNVPINFVLQ